MSKKKFFMEPHTTMDKSFLIYSEDIRLAVDYDDVDHETVEREAWRILELLNTGTKEPE